ncbi:MAG TPA: FAD-binding oxidoreductase [Thermomicrobiales bacterium]|nr:FAD-binding oxidoreductase [Thermomicrobiales bacterium]
MSRMGTGMGEELRSYWHATSELLTPAGDVPDAADVVVVGGGMLGSWTAYWLARGGANVVLVEKTAIAWGATGRNGGFIGGGVAEGLSDAIARLGVDDAWAAQELSIQGRELAKSVVAEEGIDCDLRVPGTLGLALSDDSLESMRQSVAILAERGHAAEILDRKQLGELILTPLGQDIAGGIFNRETALVHSARYLRGVAEAAQRHGARLVVAEVERLESSGDGTNVVTSGGTIQAGTVIVGLNAWTDELLPELAGLIVPVRGQILAYEPLPPVFLTGVGTSFTPTGEYWQQTMDGSIVLGGCRADAPGGDVGVREILPTEDVIASIAGIFPKLFPGLEELRVARSWAGLMAFTSDYLPIADAAPGMPGVWFAGGFCGSGMSFGPRIGQLLAEAATTGATPDALAPLRMDRPTLSPLLVPQGT